MARNILTRHYYLYIFQIYRTLYLTTLYRDITCLGLLTLGGSLLLVGESQRKNLKKNNKKGFVIIEHRITVSFSEYENRMIPFLQMAFSIALETQNVSFTPIPLAPEYHQWRTSVHSFLVMLLFIRPSVLMKIPTPSTYLRFGLVILHRIVFKEPRYQTSILRTG